MSEVTAFVPPEIEKAPDLPFDCPYCGAECEAEVVQKAYELATEYVGGALTLQTYYAMMMRDVTVECPHCNGLYTLNIRPTAWRAEVTAHDPRDTRGKYTPASRAWLPKPEVRVDPRTIAFPAPTEE